MPDCFRSQPTTTTKSRTCLHPPPHPVEVSALPGLLDGSHTIALLIGVKRGRTPPLGSRQTRETHPCANANSKARDRCHATLQAFLLKTQKRNASENVYAATDVFELVRIPPLRSNPPRAQPRSHSADSFTTPTKGITLPGSSQSRTSSNSDGSR